MKFSRRLLGKKIRTSVLMHRISIKVYENGYIIKPIGRMGMLKIPYIPFQEEMFLTNECLDYLIIICQDRINELKVIKELQK